MAGKANSTLPQIEAAAANCPNGPCIFHCYAFTPKIKASFTWTLEYICSISYLPKYEVHIKNFYLSESDGSLKKKHVCDCVNVVN